MCSWKMIRMDLKAFLVRTSNVSGLYGDDVVIVSRTAKHGSVLHGRS
jgi:hypothetical protein